ncbi:transcription factor cwo-like isoform X1 [Euwallacea similis]|uniref:transcription factor cwo-like isoform X1 n=2 Tax=Euwallacea similis TaxID=1736056 RepID=UPI00344F849C
MDITHAYWEENSNLQRVKYERCLTNEEPVRLKDDRAVYPYCDSNLNFSTATCSEDDCEYGPYKKSSKVARQDPMSHRIIEKRRRDRMNNCLADLSRLIPTDYLKKGRGRIEKTEIIEMAIKHMKHLQTQERISSLEHYRLGYQECIAEVMRFMVEIENHHPREPLCLRLLNHLQKHCEQISKAPGSPPLESVPTFSTQVPSFIRNGSGNSQAKVTEFSIPKAEPENSNSNSNDAHAVFTVRTPKSDDLEKEGNSGMSYKYKTNIKLRFTQDLSAHEVPKRQKMDDDCRSSVTIYESQNSNQSSPPCSEACTRISESETTQGQSTPDVMANPQHKPGTPQGDAIQRFSPTIAVSNTTETNFDVPIFVLHTKGSYYIPLSIDYKTLVPYLKNYNLIETLPQMQNVVLHPVTINVNFLHNFNSDLRNNNNDSKCKFEFNNNWN